MARICLISLHLILNPPPFFFTTRHNTCFEKLVKSDGAMYRTVDVNMGIPTTPKKVNGLC